MPDSAHGTSNANPQAAVVSRDTDNLLEIGAEKARACLHNNLTPHGLMAARSTPEAEARRYTRIFARDAGICALAVALSGDAALIRGARDSLHTLAQHQADNGQIPKYVSPEEADSDFWYLGCIDATLWWLIAVHFLDSRAPGAELVRALEAHIAKAIAWLRCQEHPQLHLLQQNEASDWADIMPRSGFVLYTNTLWYHVKRLYGLPHADKTKYHFNHLFYPFSQEIPDYKRLRLLTHYIRHRAADNHLYLSFVNFSFWGEEGDVLGNLLAILLGLADHGPANRILTALEKAQVHLPYPARAVCYPIAPDHFLWRSYMKRRQQNLAHQYHNGGIWPFIGGFWVMALNTLGRHEQAAAELEKLAQLNRINGWEFNEWFHGQTGAPRGMPGQAWSAAMYLLARNAATQKIF